AVGTVDVREAKAEGMKAVGLRIGPAISLAHELGGAIGRGRLGGDLLVDRRGHLSQNGAPGRGIDDRAAAALPHRLEHVEGALNVDFVVPDRILNRLDHACMRGEVDHGIGAADQAVDGRAIPNVTLEKLDAVTDFQIAAWGREIVENADVGAELVAKPRDEVCPDEAQSSGESDPLQSVLFPSPPSVRLTFLPRYSWPGRSQSGADPESGGAHAQRHFPMLIPPARPLEATTYRHFAAASE